MITSRLMKVTYLAGMWPTIWHLRAAAQPHICIDVLALRASLMSGQVGLCACGAYRGISVRGWGRWCVIDLVDLAARADSKARRLRHNEPNAAGGLIILSTWLQLAAAGYLRLIGTRITVTLGGAPRRSRTASPSLTLTHTFIRTHPHPHVIRTLTLALALTYTRYTLRHIC